MKMQDKEVLEQTEEVLKSVSDLKDKRDTKDSKERERRDSADDQSKKEQTKDGKFGFRRMKQPKKDRSEKKKLTRFENEGVSFKAKLIGVETVPDARGDKMCQETMQRLKLNVRNLGPHKRKISVSVSFQGIKVKDDKTEELIYHHPVALISFISQDITDARAFGYVAGSSNGQHQFIAIKTEKPAFHVVVALRDLFQTVLNLKQEKMDQVKEKKVDDVDTASSVGSDSINEKTSVQDNVTDSVSSVSEEEKSIKGENIYFDVILTEPFQMKEEVPCTKSVDELLGLQDELNKLQQGIEQMDTSIAAATSNLEMLAVENDPFDTSFVTPGGTKIDVFQPMPVPITSPNVMTSQNQVPQSLYEDKYAVFSTLHNEPSIFESTLNKDSELADYDDSTIPELKELEEEIRKKSTMPPAKPPRNVKTPTADPSVFADLDPLGKDRPYKDKAEFFQDVKNPPKKVLNDMVDKANGDDFPCKAFDNQCGSPVFPVSPPSLVSSSSSYNAPGLASSLPNSFLGNLKFSVACPQNGGLNLFNPFENDNQSQSFNNMNGYHVPPLPQNSISSSPIPIPNRQNIETQQRTYSNGSFGSPCSKSPLSTDYGSPSRLGQNYADVVDTSTNPLTNGTSEDKPNGIINPSLHTNGHNNQVSNLTNPKQNGVSRPRPRPSNSNKGNSVPSNGLVLPNHPLPIPPPESDNISRENRQPLSNVLRVNGCARSRAVSVPIEGKRDYSVNGNIFASKPDPFADDFFYSLPKKVVNHLTKTEIRDCV